MHPILILVPQNVLKMYRSILHILLFKKSFYPKPPQKAKKDNTKRTKKRVFHSTFPEKTQQKPVFFRKNGHHGAWGPSAPQKNDQNDDGLPVVSNHRPALRQVPPAHRRGTAGLTWRNGTLWGASWRGADSHKNHNFFK